MGGRRRTTHAHPARRKGQTTIFVALVMVALALFVMAVVNSAQLVALRIRLQNAADASALAGATVQASYLNKIAGLNKRIGSIWNVMYFRCWWPFSSDTEAFWFFKPLEIEMGRLRREQNDANDDGNSEAERQARRLAHMNWRNDWGPMRFEYWANGRRGGGADVVDLRTCPGWLMYEVVLPPGTRVWYGDVLREKADKSGRRVTYSTVRLTTEGGLFLCGRNFFGTIERVQAVAQAKPADGWIFYGPRSGRNIRPTYDVKLFPVNADIGNPVRDIPDRYRYLH